MQEVNFRIGDYKFSEGETLLLDKPYEWTSFDVVNKIRRSLTQKVGLKKFKVGHAGTLDPLATGLLILCTGKSTKTIDEIQAQEKEYIGSFYLGATRPSHDKETDINETFDITHISEQQIHDCALTFIGVQKQIPPIYSAIKKDGKRAFLNARSGKHIEMEAREVNIPEFEITRIDLPFVYFRVVCSKGTYIRSLAYDFGLRLNSGAYLDSLHRTAIGNYRVENALTIEQLEELINSGELIKY